MKYATGGAIIPAQADDDSIPAVLSRGCAMTVPAEMRPSQAMRLLEALNAQLGAQKEGQCSQP